MAILFAAKDHPPYNTGVFAIVVMEGSDCDSRHSTQQPAIAIDPLVRGFRNRRFRYTIEQVLFAQHFWETHAAERADFATLVHNHQFTFAWAGITQPETNLVAPAVQIRNLQLGQDWLAHTFGVQARTAWQS